MNNFFCISVLFHQPRFHGQGDGGTAEWPPSPLRLFQAIVAACANRGELEKARAALRWLESQPAPMIIAPPALQKSGFRIAVPNNDMDVPAAYWAKGIEPPRQKNPQGLKSLKTIRPMEFDEGDTIWYLFEMSDSTAADAQSAMKLISRAAPSITHLGWGIDMVAASARIISPGGAEELRGARWRQSDRFDSGSAHLRIPQPGTLAALEERHDAFLHRVGDDGYSPVPPLAGFATVAYDDSRRINARAFAAFDLIPLEPGHPRKSFLQKDIVRVSAMLRHAACLAAKSDLDDWRDNKWAEAFVAGHGPHDATQSFERFSYLPLPTIAVYGQPHADGMIRRAIIAETAGGDGKSAAWARRRLGAMSLENEDTKKQEAELKVVNPGGDAIFRAYTEKADAWETITPVILPGFDDNNHEKRMSLLLRCFKQVGIPLESIADIEVQKSPWQRSSTFIPRDRRSARLKHFPACHVRVYFKRPVSGPLAIGAGRHRGLGLFAAVP